MNCPNCGAQVICSNHTFGCNNCGAAGQCFAMEPDRPQLSDGRTLLPLVLAGSRD
jgi:hypothetical protein